MSAGTTGGVNCPFCGQHYSLTPEQVPQYAGQTIACTVCKRQFTVPAQLSASVGAQAAAQPAQYAQQGYAPPAAQYAPPVGYAPPGAPAWAQPAYGGPFVSPPRRRMAVASMIWG